MIAKRKSRRALTQDDTFRAAYVVGGCLSPRGDAAVYVLSETQTVAAEEKQQTSLWYVALDGGQPKRLTNASTNSRAPEFMPDGKSVLFVSTREKVSQIHRIAIDGGEAEPVTTLPQGTSFFALSPDGRWIAFSAIAAVRRSPGPNEHVRVTRSWYRFDAVWGYLHDRPHAVYVMRTSGGVPKAVTGHDGLVTGLAWSPDGEELAVVNMGRESNVDFPQADLIVVDRKGNQRTIVKNQIVASVFWTTDGRRLGYQSSSRGNLSLQPELFIVDTSGKSAPKSRTKNLNLPVGGGLQINSPAGAAAPRSMATEDGAAIVPVCAGGEMRIYRVALSGRERCVVIVGLERVCSPFDCRAGKLLFSSQTFNTPPELHLSDLDGQNERRVSAHNDAWQREIRWPDVERVVVRSAHNVDIEGWVLKPRHVRAPYKTILYIHGGPHAGFGYSFNVDFQELVGAGYAVAFANPRGSTGYGNVFSTSIIERWGELETQDFNAFLDALIKRGIAHKDRLGVTGVSGGGHLSGWLIGHTHRFKAAVPEQGVYNMTSMYGVSDAGSVLIALEMGGAPHEVPERYWALSPLAHAHKCRTPTLLIQGEKDLRCPMEQAEEIYTVLKRSGCTVELLRLKNCNHGLEIAGSPPLARYRMDAMIDWFNRYIH